jgi:hypothetical protein
LTRKCAKTGRWSEHLTASADEYASTATAPAQGQGEQVSVAVCLSA